MRIIDKFHNQVDEFVHPFWLGILILFSVIAIIGTFCCLRIKCGSQIRYLFNRLFGINSETNDSNSNDDRNSTISYSYNWPPFFTPTKSHSPKLYTLVKNIQTANFQKQLSLKQQSSNEDENEIDINSSIEMDNLPQISVSPLTNAIRNSEIARKFYASMRNTSQCQNSSSVDSYNNDASLTSNAPSLNLDQPVKSSQQGRIKLFRIPRFFRSIPQQDGVVIEI